MHTAYDSISDPTIISPIFFPTSRLDVFNMSLSAPSLARCHTTIRLRYIFLFFYGYYAVDVKLLMRIYRLLVNILICLLYRQRLHWKCKTEKEGQKQQTENVRTENEWPKVTCRSWKCMTISINVTVCNNGLTAWWMLIIIFHWLQCIRIYFIQNWQSVNCTALVYAMNIICAEIIIRHCTFQGKRLKWRRTKVSANVLS